MRFTAKLKECLSGLLLAGVATWFAGCSETASTSPTTPNPTPPKVKSGDSAGSTVSKGTGTGSASDNAGMPSADGDDEQAGSSTGGREVPEATP